VTRIKKHKDVEANEREMEIWIDYEVDNTYLKTGKSQELSKDKTKTQHGKLPYVLYVS